jgi:hypothetical protein
MSREDLMLKYMVVRRHPKTGKLVDTETGETAYAVGAEVVNPAPLKWTSLGPSLHTTPMQAIQEAVPPDSVGRRWPAVLIRVRVWPRDIVIWQGCTDVRRFTVERIEREVHPDIAQRGFSAYRVHDAERWLADGWGRFVIASTRETADGLCFPGQVPVADRQKHRILCWPSGMRRTVAYRAQPLAIARPD